MGYDEVVIVLSLVVLCIVLAIIVMHKTAVISEITSFYSFLVIH